MMLTDQARFRGPTPNLTANRTNLKRLDIGNNSVFWISVVQVGARQKVSADQL
jgi:hypothetical protein